MSEHDVLKKNRNFYIGVGGTVLEGLLSGSLFMLLYSVMQFLWSGQFDMNRVLVLTCVIAVVFLLRILIYSYGYTKAQIGGAAVSKNIRLFMGNHLKRIPLSRFSQGQTGDYINTITSDVNNYEKILTHKVGDFAKNFALSLMLIVFVMTLYVPAGIILLIADDKFLEDYWENSRGGDNLYSVYWLYNITGEQFLLELARKLHRNTADWTNESDLPNWHNVNIAQCFREPATYYMLSGDSADLQASYRVHHLVRRIFGQVPGGMFGADENARLAYIDPRQGTETCGFVEQMASDEIMLRMTGDPFWAEHCEEVAFNSYPAAVMPDFKALRYITCPNQVVSDSKDHKPGIDNGGPFLAMNPFSSRCCQHNHAQGWPYYIENLVYATPDNGLAAIIYGPCCAQAKVGVNGTEVILREETNYPFEEMIRFTVQVSGKVDFPLYLRVPAWCKGGTLIVNGETVAAGMESGKYVRLDRTWSNGDVVILQLPMSLSVQRWQTNQNSASVNYGPLTFSLLIEEEYRKVSSAENAIWDSKWQKGADVNAWPTYEIYPQSAWNYALKLDDKVLEQCLKVEKREWPSDNYPFTADNVPLVIKAQGRRVPSWGIDQYGLCGVLPEEGAPKSEILEDITLIPMGAARLRISAFPVTYE